MNEHKENLLGNLEESNCNLRKLKGEQGNPGNFVGTICEHSKIVL